MYLQICNRTVGKMPLAGERDGKAAGAGGGGASRPGNHRSTRRGANSINSVYKSFAHLDTTVHNHSIQPNQKYASMYMHSHGSPHPFHIHSAPPPATRCDCILSSASESLRLERDSAELRVVTSCTSGLVAAGVEGMSRSSSAMRCFNASRRFLSL